FCVLCVLGPFCVVKKLATLADKHNKEVHMIAKIKNKTGDGPSFDILYYSTLIKTFTIFF
ncbi:hypothetical protein EB118_15155, partial [bacterium]|nr:hypothetical protein [bacterium]